MNRLVSIGGYVFWNAKKTSDHARLSTKESFFGKNQINLDIFNATNLQQEFRKQNIIILFSESNF